MGKLKSGILFTGSLGDFTAYRRKDSNEIHIRVKTGPTRKTIKTARNYENTRRNNAEFGARSSTTRDFRQALMYHWHVADYNPTGPLNALLHPIQKLDTNPWGQRSVCLSRYPRLVEGFTLNQRFGLDHYVRAQISWSLSRDTGEAFVVIPALYADVNLLSPQPQSWFRFVVSVGTIADRIYNADRKKFVAAAEIADTVAATTAWHFWGQPFEETRLALAFPASPPDALTLILTVGIEFGKLGILGGVEPVRKGAARIVAAV